ncbi:MAG: endonuclease V [Polyangiaceae bacterium]
MPAAHSPPCPLAIVDVQYRGAGASAACVVAAAWGDAVGIEERTAELASVEPYRPRRFFERELPCILAVLACVESPLSAIVIDGYVELDAQGTAGLGGRLHQHYEGRYVVIGVAKTAYRGSAFAAPVLRGQSARPLFVTARGIEIDAAARLVAAMHGAHRVPTLLARADRLARIAAG